MENQSQFHDHIIRNDQEFQRIRNYIINNPKNWDTDSLRWGFTIWLWTKFLLVIQHLAILHLFSPKIFELYSLLIIWLSNYRVTNRTERIRLPDFQNYLMPNRVFTEDPDYSLKFFLLWQKTTKPVMRTWRYGKGEYENQVNNFHPSCRHLKIKSSNSLLNLLFKHWNNINYSL